MTSAKGFAFTVAIYSAFCVRTSERIETLKAYLYDHTELTSNLYFDLKDGEVDSNGFTYGVLVTTLHGNSTASDDTWEHGSGFAKAVQDCRRLADYQCDRLASGLIVAVRTGDQYEAEAWCAERVSI